MPLRTLAFSLFCFSLLPLPAPGQQQSTTGQGSIEGRTLAADGQPLRKTNVVLRPLPVFNGGRGGAGSAGAVQTPTPYGTTSDAEGKFSFTNLDPGRYTLTAEHTGYLSTQYGMKRTSTGAQTGNPNIQLAAGQHITELVIQLTPQGVIAGKATDEDGDPMPRVRVTAQRKMYGIGGARLMNQGGGVTDDNGEFRLPNLTPGRYYVSFSPLRAGPLQTTRRAGGEAAEPELGYATVYYPGALDVSGAAAVDVGEGQEKAGINIRMHQVPVYHIRGKLSGDLSAAPAGPAQMSNRPQISVSPSGSAMGGLSTQIANPDGSFDIAGLTPGPWTVSVLRMQGATADIGRIDCGHLPPGRERSECGGSGDGRYIRSSAYCSGECDHRPAAAERQQFQ